MRTIAVAIRKGGSGKTTTAINLASALQQKGKNVLLVDLDPQANSTICVGIDPLTLNVTVKDLFQNVSLRPEDVIIQTSFGLHIMPSHPELQNIQDGMKAAQVGVLKGLFAPLENKFDYIIIDTPPLDGALTVAALAYVNEVIVPVETHYLALHGLAQFMHVVEDVRRGLNPGLKLLGILPTKVDERTNISRAILSDLEAHYKDNLFPMQIDFSVRHIESTLAGKPIVLFDPEHPGAQAYTKFAEYVDEQRH